MKTITIGKWVQEEHRLGLENWKSPRQIDAFRDLVNESNALTEAKAVEAKNGHRTPEGIKAMLRDRVRDRTLPILTQARETAALAANEELAVRAGLRDRLWEKSSPRADRLREEQRIFLRSLPPEERTKISFEAVYAMAIIEQPAAMSGIAPGAFEHIETSLLDRTFPGALAAAKVAVQASEFIAGAAAGLEAQLRADGLIKTVQDGRLASARLPRSPHLCPIAFRSSHHATPAPATIDHVPRTGSVATATSIPSTKMANLTRTVQPLRLNPTPYSRCCNVRSWSAFGA